MNKVVSALVLVMIFGLASAANAEKKSDALKDLVKSYEKVSAALVNDDMKAAKVASVEFEKAAKAAEQDKLVESIAKFGKGKTLKAMRAEYKATSKEVVKLVHNKDEYFVMTCPMAKADWVQTSEKISNPFMGKRMPACGRLKANH